MLFKDPANDTIKQLSDKMNIIANRSADIALSSPGDPDAVATAISSATVAVRLLEQLSLGGVDVDAEIVALSERMVGRSQC